MIQRVGAGVVEVPQTLLVRRKRKRICRTPLAVTSLIVPTNVTFPLAVAALAWGATAKDPRTSAPIRIHIFVTLCSFDGWLDDRRSATADRSARVVRSKIEPEDAIESQRCLRI